MEMLGNAKNDLGKNGKPRNVWKRVEQLDMFGSVGESSEFVFQRVGDARQQTLGESVVK